MATYIENNQWLPGNAIIPYCGLGSLGVPDMTVCASYAEGQTWPGGRLLHLVPSSYSDVAVLLGGEKHVKEWVMFAQLPTRWLPEGNDG